MEIGGEEGGAEGAQQRRQQGGVSQARGEGV
jgi:hypothetical protein